MHKICNKFLTLVLLASVPLLFAACGGGGGSGSAAADNVNITGVAVKGPIKGALVQVYKLQNNGAEGELLGSSTSGNGGAYTVAIPRAKAIAPLLVKVRGQAGATFTRESGGTADFTTAESFNAVLDTFSTSTSYAVTPLTDAAYQQLQKFITANPATAVSSIAVSAVNARVGTLFNVGNILTDSPTAAGSPYSSVLTIIDQMIVDNGAGSTTLQAMNTINQGLVDVTQPAYQTFRGAFTTAAANAGIQNTPVVQAILAQLASPPAEPVLTDLIAPNKVTGLTAAPAAETATTSSVSLSWTAATTSGTNQVIGYEIYRAGSKIASVTSTSYIDGGLTPSTTYSYHVIAFDSAGKRSVASNTVSVTTPASPNLNVTVDGQLGTDVLGLPAKDIIKPAAPNGLAATATAINATTSSVALTWIAATDNVGVTSYDVYRAGTKIGSSTQASFTDPSVTSGVAYSYYVIALDAAGNSSAASTAFSITPVAPNLGVTIDGQVQVQ